MKSKTIRIWNGCKVVQVITVYAEGGNSSAGAVGGAHNSSRPDIEIDPWAGLIVEHEIKAPPVAWRAVDGE